MIVSNGINNNTAGVAGVDRPGQRRGRRDAFVRRNQKEKDSSKNEKLLPTDILDINSSRDRSTPDSDD